MKRLILLALLIPGLAFAGAPTKWIINPQTGEPDYYQDLETDSGVSVPQPYQANPTLTSLRDLLVAAGIMEEAPAAPGEPSDFIVGNKALFKIGGGNLTVGGG